MVAWVRRFVAVFRLAWVSSKDVFVASQVIAFESLLPVVPAKRHRVVREVGGKAWVTHEGTDARLAAQEFVRVRSFRADGVCRWQEDTGTGWRDRDVYTA